MGCYHGVLRQAGGNVGWSIMSVIIKKAKETPGISVMEGYKVSAFSLMGLFYTATRCSHG